MAQVMQIHKVDNGYFIQTVEKEGSPLEGISIANNMTEVETLVHAKLCEIEGVQKGIIARTSDGPERNGISEGPPIQFKQPDGDDGHHLPAGFSEQESPDAYEAELRRLVDDNDRDAAHERLKAHVDAGRLEPYKPRLGIKNLVDLIRIADKLLTPAAEETETVNAAPNGTLPSGAPLPDGVPPPTGHDPFAIDATTREHVQVALQAAAQRTDVATAFGVLKQLGFMKITDLPADKYDEAIALANQIG